MSFYWKDLFLSSIFIQLCINIKIWPVRKNRHFKKGVISSGPFPVSPTARWWDPFVGKHNITTSKNQGGVSGKSGRTMASQGSAHAKGTGSLKSIQCSRWQSMTILWFNNHGTWIPSIWITFERIHQFWVSERPLWKCKLVKVRFFMVSVGYDTSLKQGVFKTILSSVSLHLFSFWQPWKFGDYQTLSWKGFSI